MARALPTLSGRDRRELLRTVVDFLGLNLFHALAAPRLLKTSAAIIEDLGAGADNRSVGSWLTELCAQKRGVFVLSGHIGCWELTGGWLAGVVADRGLGSLGVVTGTVHNPAVDRLLQRHRRSLGLRLLPRDGGAAAVIRHLRAGGVVAVLQDQQTQVRNREIPFLGYPAPTPVALAVLALRYGVPVLPVAGVWDEQRQVHVVHHLPPVLPADYESADELAFLTSCNRALGELILRNPEQWVWFHQRWRREDGDGRL